MAKAKIKPKKERPDRDLRVELAKLGPRPCVDEREPWMDGVGHSNRVRWLGERAAVAQAVRRRNQVSDPLETQQRHSPTVEIAVNDSEDKKRVRRNLTRVRQSEAWRQNQLTDLQRRAQTEIGNVWKSIVGAQFAGVSKYGPPSPRETGISPAEFLGDNSDVWQAMVALNKKEDRGVLISAVIDCIAEPWTLTQVEQRHRLKPGMAFTNFVRGLDLWCEVRGWARRNANTLDKLPIVAL